LTFEVLRFQHFATLTNGFKDLISIILLDGCLNYSDLCKINCI